MVNGGVSGPAGKLRPEPAFNVSVALLTLVNVAIMLDARDP